MNFSEISVISIVNKFKLAPVTGTEFFGGYSLGVSWLL